MNLLKKLTPYTLSFFLVACGNDDIDPNVIDAPNTYDFASIVDPSSPSSVEYNEATTRLILIQELEYLLASDYLQKLGEAKVEEIGLDNAKAFIVDLLNAIYTTGTKSGPLSLVTQNIYDFYDPNNEESTGSTQIKGINFYNGNYSFSSLQANINLLDAMPGISNDLHNRKEDESLGNFIGWAIAGDDDGDIVPNELIQYWFSQVARIATDGDEQTKSIYINVDYKALITSFLSASIPYFQISNVHLHNASGLNTDNLTAVQNQPYTQLEHSWDMAFGYFGTSRSSNLKSLETIINQHNKVTDLASLSSDSVFDTAAFLAQRDLSTPSFVTPKFKPTVTAFLEGREVITLRELDITTDRKKALISHNAQTIIANWEMAIIENLIHHINNTIDFGPYISSGFLSSYQTSWSKMKAYALALQFNPYSTISLDSLDYINDQISIRPETRVNSVNGYLGDILNARSVLQNHFGIPEEAIFNW